jgi:phosphoglycerate dehydrogenase-like enzyme
MSPPLVFDPFVPAERVVAENARPASLDEVLSQADFVSLHCPLNDQTRNLIGARELDLMKPTAWLINTARGGIVDEQALDAALRERRIAGAALDCFIGEPLAAPPRYADLDNVLLAPHAIAWTNELFREIGRTACQSLADLARGLRPHGVVNPDVFERPGFQEKWARWRLS